MRLAAVVLGVVLVAHVAPEAGATEDPWEQALAHERRGELEQALALLEQQPAPLAADEASRTHLQHLRGAVMALEGAELQTNAGRPDAARKLLEGALGELDPLSEAALASALHTALAEVDARAVRGFWRRTGAPLGIGMVTVLEWSLYFLVAAAVLLGLRWLRRLVLRAPRAGTALLLEDLTAEAEARIPSSTMLEKQLAVCVHTLRELVSHGPSRFDAGLPEGTAFMRPATPELRLDELVVDGTAIRVGPLSVSPRQLLAMLRSLWRRPYEQTIGGWLSEDDGKLRLVMERVRHGKAPEASDRWESVSTSKSRAEVIEDAARHMLFVLGKPAFTSCRESFVLYCRGMQRLQAKELVAAKQDLQASLRRDPSNWMARLELAELLCKLRNPTAAIAHLDHLEQRLERADGGRPAGVDEDLRRSVRFDRAVALSMLGRRRWSADACRIFDELLESKPDDAVVRSARAAAWLANLDDDGSQLEPATKAIEDELAWIEQHEPASPDAWIDHAQAYARIATVHARALLAGLAGRSSTHEDHERIKKELYSAMAMMPDFPDPYVTLAQLQMKGRDEHYPSWIQEAEENLRTVLSMDPSNELVHYLLGKFYALPAVARYEDAKEELAKAPSIAKSHWKLAEIHHAQGDIPGAFEHMRRSIFLDHRADERLWIFVGWALARLAEREDPALVEETKEKARRLAKRGVDPKLRSKGEALLEQLEHVGKAA